LKKQEKYYELFPPKEMNVRLAKLNEIPQPDGTKIVKRALLASKSFKEGQTIFTEKPVVSALHPALEVRFVRIHCYKWYKLYINYCKSNLLYRVDHSARIV
jgi:import receptor subunit TOM20